MDRINQPALVLSHPEIENEGLIFSFFIDFWKKLRDKYPFVNDQSNEKDSPFVDLDASFLIVNASGIYYIASDTSVTKFEKYYAIGSGCDYSFGALHALYDGNDNAESLANKAVQAAIDLNIYCGGYINIKKIK